MSNPDIPQDKSALQSNEPDSVTISPESATTAHIYFPLVPGAVNYGYSIQSASSEAEAVSLLSAAAETNTESVTRLYPTYDSASGLYMAEIPGLTTYASYNIKIWATRAEAIDNNTKWDNVLTVNDYVFPEADTSSTTPSAYLVSFKNGIARIGIENEISKGNMQYKVVLNGGTLTNQEYNLSKIEDNILIISDLDPSATYQATISQRYFSTEDETTKPYSQSVTLEIKGNDLNTMELSFLNNTFIVTDVPESASFISLDKNDENETEIKTKTRDNSVMTITTEEINKLTAGQFIIRAYNEDIEVVAESNVISAFVPYTSITENIAQQHYSMSFDYDTTLTDFEVSGAQITLDNEKGLVTVTFSDLQSKTHYSNNLRAILSVDGYSYTITPDFTTTSFAGSYAFESYTTTGQYKQNVFKVIVEDAPSNSSYKYYVYEDESGSKHRIMPILDSTTGESVPQSDYTTYNKSSSESYNCISMSSTNSYNLAYSWNNTKWNASTAIPVGWNPDSVTGIGTDSVSSIVESFADFPLWGTLVIKARALTTTIFELVETDGTPALIFYNKITGGDGTAVIGNAYLRKNPDVSDGNAEEAYYFTLSKTIEVTE